ncbi:hypothetical protein V6N12_031519 [Hibiscus sabdariffa]|uniref:Uncharacterized protein n=1 Tax=Hibiscus sabdariffa TaxID=183260 RepID=A0ABR2CPI6_9ROSI
MFSPKLVFGSPPPVHERIIKRPDPLRHLKDYKGFFNVTNKHYWASTAFTGIHGYAMAGVWTLCGVCLGIFMIFKNLISSNESSSSSSWFTVHLERILAQSYLFCCSKPSYGNCSDEIVTFACDSTQRVAASFVIAANQISLQRTKKLENTLVLAGHDVTISIRKLITAMTRMQYLLLPYDQKTAQELNVTAHRLGKESRMINNFITSHKHSLNVAIHIPYIAHLGVCILNMLLLVSALVVCWVLTGFDFFLHIFAEDTCSTFEDYVQEPDNNSLRSILPCMNSTKSEKILTGIGSTIHNFIFKLNLKITEVCNKMGMDEQSLEMLGFRTICDPFTGPPSYNYEPEACAKDAMPISKIPDFISEFTCYDENSTQTCLEYGKFIPKDTSNKALAYSYTIESLLNVFPDLQNLTECVMVKSTLSEISLNQCRPFMKSLLWQWASMLSLSVSMMFLELTLILKTYQEKGRNFYRFSIFPNRSNSTNIEQQNVQSN